jgi:hypothetical protein
LGVKSFFFWVVFRWVSPEKTAAPPPSALYGDGSFIKRERGSVRRKGNKMNK